jgi:hypothetical protein
MDGRTMQKLVSFIIFQVAVAVLLFCNAADCRADVLYIHDHRSTEYLMGSQDSDLLIGYTSQAMFIDKKTRYTGEMMKSLFGKVHEGRETTHFLLGMDQIRQMDYHRNKIVIFPFKRLTDINWLKEKHPMSELEAEVIRERYRVVEPVLSVKILPKKETIMGFPCRLVVVDLRMETIDLKRNSSSVTLVNQKLWVSEAVPGYGQYKAFHEKLAKRLGFDAVRLGGLSGVLRYWDGSLGPVSKSIKNVKGYPVKSLLRVDGHYTAGVGTASAKTHSAVLKEESIELRQVQTEKPIKDRFAEPSDFGVLVVE